MDRGLRPESRLIGFKLVLLLYIVIASYDESRPAWSTIAILLYICLDLLAHMARGALWKTAAQALTAAFIAAAAYLAEPMMAMLLPIQLIGLSSVLARRLEAERKRPSAVEHERNQDMRRLERPSRLTEQKQDSRRQEQPGRLPERNGGVAELLHWPTLLHVLPALAPVLLLPGALRPPYLLIALLSLLFHRLLAEYSRKCAASQAAIETLRAHNDRLQRSLGESNDYIRQSEYTFKLEERNRLSQEIHDKIGHSMTGALIQMEAAKRLQEADPARSAELLQNAIRISKDGIESIRQVLRDTKPLSEQLGLNRLRLFIDEFGSTHGLSASLTFEGDIGRIEQLHWRIIHQNVTEALTNTVKYAKASSASVHIEVLNTMIKACVSDNGAGAKKVVKGLGIAGMEERTAAVNGKVIVDGSAGFSVTTLIPYTQS